MNDNDRRPAEPALVEALKRYAQKVLRGDAIPDIEKLVYDFDLMVIPARDVLGGDLTIKGLVNTAQCLVALPNPRMENIPWEKHRPWEDFIKQLVLSWTRWPTQVNGIPLFKLDLSDSSDHIGKREWTIYYNDEGKRELDREKRTSAAARDPTGPLSGLIDFMAANGFKIEFYAAVVKDKDEIEIRVDFYADVEADVPEEVRLLLDA